MWNRQTGRGKSCQSSGKTNGLAAENSLLEVGSHISQLRITFITVISTLDLILVYLKVILT